MKQYQQHQQGRGLRGWRTAAAVACAVGIALTAAACSDPGPNTTPSGNGEPVGPLFGPTGPSTTPSASPSQAPPSTAPAPSSPAGLKLDVDTAAREFAAKSSGYRVSLSAVVKERLASTRESLSAARFSPSACAPYVVATNARLPINAKAAMAASSAHQVTFFWVPSQGYAQRELKAKETVEKHCSKVTVSASAGSATVETVYFAPAGITAPDSFGLMRRISDSSGSSSQVDHGTTVVVFNGTVGIAAAVKGTNGAARKEATELAKRAYASFMGSAV
ncbi:hypothetical protein [Galactobacter valiniphilus]|nr:hypothetical protein [Galactobacter valiniphilus]